MVVGERDSYFHVTQVGSYPFYEGRPDGVTLFTTELARRLKEQKGCKVDFVSPKGKKPYAYVPGTKFFGKTVELRNDDTVRESGYAISPWAPRQATEIFLETRPDLVVYQEPLGGHIAHPFISGAPRQENGDTLSAMIGQLHANRGDISMKAWLMKQLYKVGRPQYRNGWWTPGGNRTVIGALDGIIAVSGATRDFWKGQFPYMETPKVIYNGIDTDELTPDGPKLPQWDDGKKTIFFAGRHDPRKGIEYLLYAFSILREKREDIKLMISGDGQETENLKKLAQRLGIASDVTFLGNLDRNKPEADIDLVRAYRSADIFVSPALDGEGFGRTLAEAMSCGIPTIGSDIGGYREVIGNCWFTQMAEPANSFDLAEKIEAFLNLTDQQRSAIGNESASYVRRRFSWDIIATEIMKYYLECTQKHGNMLLNSDWEKAEEEYRTRRRFPRAGDIFRGRRK